MLTLTIVTALLRGDENILKTAATVLPQLNEHSRWLIKYSDSELPESLKMLSVSDKVKIVTQKDTHLYQGLNQALKHVQTTHFVVIGAGDTLEPNAIDLALNLLNANISFSALFFAVQNASYGGIALARPAELPTRMSCPHPGTLMKTELALSINGFDEKYEIASDYDLISRYVRNFPNCAWSDQVLMRYAIGGISYRRILEAYMEEELIRARVWKSPQEDVCRRTAAFFNRMLQGVSQPASNTL